MSVQLAAAATTSPTFMSQYGPLIAALIALGASMTTLWVTGRRESFRLRVSADDEYRREQRQAMATIAVAAHNFRRNATALADLERLQREGYQAMTRLREETEAASAGLLNSLTVGRLLVQDGSLQSALDGLVSSWTVTSGHVRDMFDAFWAEDPASVLTHAESLAGAWNEFDRAAALLHGEALSRLVPSAAA